jgi:hypothetical protein
MIDRDFSLVGKLSKNAMEGRSSLTEHLKDFDFTGREKGRYCKDLSKDSHYTSFKDLTGFCVKNALEECRRTSRESF